MKIFQHTIHIASNVYWDSLMQMSLSIQFESKKLTYSTLCEEEFQDVLIKGNSHDKLHQWKQLNEGGNSINIMHLRGSCEILSIQTNKEASTLMGRTQEPLIRLEKVTISCHVLFILDFLQPFSIGFNVVENGFLMVMMQRRSSMKF